jgi:cellulose synthase/poly-beta-1,6-N-acetylglucosamine synthase-like glycosyltransferase
VLKILIPVYNDWQNLQQVTNELNVVLKGIDFSIIAVNDGSSEEINFKNDRLTILNLNQNLGHQRAIAIGLCFIQENFNSSDFVLVMDSDGEDKPSDVLQLFDSSNKSGLITFAKRVRRQENLLFRLLYFIYKVLFRSLVGKQINFGNFCVIPFEQLRKITSQPDLWNHFSGSILKSKLNFKTFDCDRGKRYFGESKMNLVSLVIHGLSSISVQLEVVSVRIMLLSTLFGVFTFIAIGAIIILRLTTELFVPGWASTVLILLIVLSFIVFSISLLLSLGILLSRNTVTNAPINYFNNYILKNE